MTRGKTLKGALVCALAFFAFGCSEESRQAIQTEPPAIAPEPEQSPPDDDIEVPEARATFPNRLTPVPVVPSVVGGTTSNATHRLRFGISASPTMEFNRP